MRVAHVINALTSGGAERVVVDLVNEQRRQGIEADIVALTDRDAVYGEKDLRHGARLEVLAPGASPYSPQHALQLIDALAGRTVVHAHLFPSQYWVRLAAASLPSPPLLVTTEHSTFNRRRNLAWLRPLERWIFDGYSVVAISKETAKEQSAWLHVPCQRITVIENGVDLERFSSARAIERSRVVPDSAPADVLLLMVSRFGPEKDHATVLRALALLPSNYRLLLVGEGDGQDQTRQLVRELELSDRVHFLGYRSDVAGILRMADVAIQSSNWEGFGLVAVEAMASGVPVVASDVPGLSAVVSGAGCLFERGNDAQLAQRIREVVQQPPAERDALLSAQSERAARYGLARMAERTIELYRRELGKDGG